MKVRFVLQIQRNTSYSSPKDSWLEKWLTPPFTPRVGDQFVDGDWEVTVTETLYQNDHDVLSCYTIPRCPGENVTDQEMQAEVLEAINLGWNISPHQGRLVIPLDRAEPIGPWAERK